MDGFINETSKEQLVYRGLSRSGDPASVRSSSRFDGVWTAMLERKAPPDYQEFPLASLSEFRGFRLGPS
jgi:hypothetical protein